ncbi:MULTISPECIES: chaplin [unclassified Streptomyces]|uniref:chaplin n=1 Tax=unclassified Streptomyces TaxID=2593676 RepID=UPI00380046A4
MKKSAAVVAGLILALGGAAPAFADTGAGSGPGPGAVANGAAIGSPGVLSGNVVQAPINIPINLCGNSVNVLAALNPTSGNVCVNG